MIVRLLKQIVGVSLILCAIVLPHEAGHYATARLFGVGVQRFSLGFGPVLFSHRSGMTEWAVSAIPAGGYVSLLESPPEGVQLQGVPKELFVSGQPPLHQFIIAVAGSCINFLMVLAIVPLLIRLARGGTLTIADVELQREKKSGFIGPIGILQIAGEAVLRGMGASLAFIARFSLGIGMLQLIPIPMLDGSHALAAITQAFGAIEEQPYEAIGIAVIALLILYLYRVAGKVLSLFRATLFYREDRLSLQRESERLQGPL